MLEVRTDADSHQTFSKKEQRNRSAKLNADTDSFMESIVCSIKNQEYSGGICPTCLENDGLN